MHRSETAVRPGERKEQRDTALTEGWRMVHATAVCAAMILSAWPLDRK
jgi:hypothetical protein